MNQNEIESIPQEEVSSKKLDAVATRTNLNETAFFFPSLKTDETGAITFSFTIPEALTKWKMMGFAHTKDMKTGFIEQEVITQKELMVEPNVPRFLHEGDTIILKAKITNLTSNAMSGKARLQLFDAISMKSLDATAALINAEKSFSADKGRSTFAEWKFVTPSGLSGLTYKIVAASETFSDGEEATIPVLPDRMLVIETIPMYVRGRSTKDFELKKLTSNTSTTLRNYKLTLQMTSNPSWYAIQALPMLIEFPHECAEQTFNRFYANSIASHIVNSSPKIKKVFESWKTSDALLSNLQKNQDVKQILLQETPWVMQGQDETERKNRIALLFDLNTMSNNLGSALQKLQEKQLPNGGWAWFPGMPESRYITQYIISGFGHLKELGVTEFDSKTASMIQRAITFLDNELVKDYKELKRYVKEKNMDEDHIGYEEYQYLYGRSYFTEQEIPSETKEAFTYYKGQAKKYWTGKGLMIQGMSALALDRFGEKTVPQEIMRSLKERTLHSDEMGTYWKGTSSWYWYDAPIETQALMIEAFDEVAKDKETVEELKIWLLNQKRVQDWRTTIATADACYALLRRGTDLLASDKLVDVTVGGVKLDPRKMDGVKVEEGTGYYSTSWNGAEIKPAMGKVTLSKSDEGIAWGGMFWQYYERLDNITSSATGPLSIEKKLFLTKNTDKGKQLEPITEKNVLHIGDVVTVRVVVTVDRQMEYVHLKDARAACFEPVTTLSQYKYQGGLGYYESMKDASNNFFIGYLPKGTYVLEYPLRVSQQGTFIGGISSIQSMYAPEFSNHSEGIVVNVK